MRRQPKRDLIKRVLVAVVMGASLTVLSGCFPGGGPLRHALYGRPYPQTGYGYQSTYGSAPDSYPETETRGNGPMAGPGYRRGAHCGW